MGKGKEAGLGKVKGQGEVLKTNDLTHLLNWRLYLNHYR
jgi:hypothetical protein